MGTVRDALRLPDIRRIELGYGWSVTGELAGTVSLVVFAFGAGGAALVAAYAASRTLAGMVVALVLAGVINRFRRDRLLRCWRPRSNGVSSRLARSSCARGKSATTST